MLSLKISLIVLFWLTAAFVLCLLLARVRAGSITRGRLFDDEAGEPAAPTTHGVADMGWLRRWLYLAGYRSAAAPVGFFVVTVLALALGLGSALALQLSGLSRLVAAGVESVPGGVGQVFLPIALLFPWLVGLLLAGLPWLAVRASRRRRVQSIEQDLPLAMELLATLSEAGIGFDAALARIMETRLGGRPLMQEFRTFQADLLGGRPRVESLRRLSQRIQISPISIFVSAMAQAEQIGMGIAGVLQRQAEDLRQRRRQRASAFAAGLPVKRMLPLVVCFLPGLFVWTLGPFFVQLFKIADTFTRVRGI